MKVEVRMPDSLWRRWQHLHGAGAEYAAFDAFVEAGLREYLRTRRQRDDLPTLYGSVVKTVQPQRSARG